MTTLDSKSKVPLFAVISALPVLVGGIFWLSVIYYKVEAAEKINEKQDLRIEMQYNLLIEIRDPIIKMEEHQKIKER